MNHNTPLSPRPLVHLERTQRRVMSIRELRAHGVPADVLAERCRPGGPWQQILPQVILLHSGPATGEDRAHAAILYASRPPHGQHCRSDALITGLAALALYRFEAVPPLIGLDRIDVLVPRQRRLRDAGEVKIRRAHSLPHAETVRGLPCAPVSRAIADAIAGLEDDPATVRALLIESVRAGHCESGAVVKELAAARLLSRPHVVDAVDALLAEGRTIAEDRLYEMVRCFELPDPVWNVDLRVPGGPYLGGVDAYWPDHAVALELDARAPQLDDDVLWAEYARKQEHLERLGISVIRVTPKKLRESLEQQAMVVRTALIDAEDSHAHAYVVVLPR
ncbi:MAG: hypothetical protein JO362_19665 [Streptomycetaceae bacterium]|nr:hypothetical protein [Streptomycetaceae bacterium]